MSSPPTTMTTAAEPAWLAGLRDRGRQALASAAMPLPYDEDWKYVDIDFDLDDFRPAEGPSGGLDRDVYLEELGEASSRLTMVDGTVVDIEAGEVEIHRSADIPDGRLAGLYGSMASPQVDVFAAANHALAPPGAVVAIPAGRTLTAPVVVDIQAVAAGAVSFPHVTVVAGPDSEASVVVLYRSAPGAELLISPIVEALADRGARLSVSVVQNLSGAARIVAHHEYVAERDSTLRIGEVGLGGLYARQRLGISLDGRGSSAQVSGIYFGDGSQVLDYRTHVTHRGPRTTSDIFLKGAVADDAQAVWTGLVRIEKGAEGTSAFETNRNLVLSDGAMVNSVPNLEILTDDLQCGHGSSSGPLDEQQLYYLMSRGLPRSPAEHLLVRAFFNEILSGFAAPELAAPSRRAVATKFAGAQQRAAS
ncbi:MAG: Fe-S cluster assembly protein SufD [Acidimicrobiia bacterium]|nr:Fe-S cluster assembly protein SufD [Acidimicrobiia bacterium]